jgi:CheY-like chemotaxis protein
MSATLRPILAAEDEETDRFILNLAFGRAKLPHPLVTVCDGKECVDYLSGAGAFADRMIHPLPALLLLDLKMPQMDGFEVLAWLATRTDLKDLPAVVLSSSSSEADIQKACALGARDYLVKPHALPELVKILHHLQSRWLAGSLASSEQLAYERAEESSRPAKPANF